MYKDIDRLPPQEVVASYLKRGDFAPCQVDNQGHRRGLKRLVRRLNEINDGRLEMGRVFEIEAGSTERHSMWIGFGGGIVSIYSRRSGDDSSHGSTWQRNRLLIIDVNSGDGAMSDDPVHDESARYTLAYWQENPDQARYSANNLVELATRVVYLRDLVSKK